MIDGADAPDSARRRIRPGEPADAEVLELAGDMPRLAEVRQWTGDVLYDLTDEEFALILRKAAELAETPSATSRSAGGLTLDEMKAAAAQAGLDPLLVEPLNRFA